MDRLAADQVCLLYAFTVSAQAKNSSNRFPMVHMKRRAVYTNLVKLKAEKHFDNPLVLETFVLKLPAWCKDKYIWMKQDHPMPTRWGALFWMS